MIAAQVPPCVPVYAKKLLSVDDAIPKESPKDYAIPKEPLKELVNNQTKYRSKPKPEEENCLESSEE